MADPDLYRRAQLMVVLDTTIMLIALPSAQHDLGFSVASRQWVITAYTITFGGLLLLGGRLSDLLGPKRALTIGVSGFAAASALGGAAPDLGVLAGARALQGIFGALLAPAVLAVLTTTFTDDRERGRAFGIWAAIATSGAALGLILSGVLTQYLGWRWCLYVNVPIAVVVAVGVAATVPAAGLRVRARGRGYRHSRATEHRDVAARCRRTTSTAAKLGYALLTKDRIKETLHDASVHPNQTGPGRADSASSADSLPRPD